MSKSVFDMLFEAASVSASCTAESSASSEFC